MYIGQSVDITLRWYKYQKLHCKSQHVLLRSFKKYGCENHKFEIICQCDKSELNNLEKYYVDLYQTFNSEFGMNLKDGGGSNGKHSDETKRKMSASALGKKRKPFTEDTKLKMSNHAKTRTHTEETKKKISDYVKANPISYWKGKKRSQETIDKIRQTKSRKRNS